MTITELKVTVSELAKNYSDDGEGGVFAYNGKLTVRPPYQREFIYRDDKRDAVIDSITKDYPLNVMYWAKCADGTFEVLDGQQRTISICQYIEGNYCINYRYFHNLTQQEKQKIFDYKLNVYICEGTEAEKLAWFKIINIAGEKLTDQELLNAVYSGPWVTDAKKYFSKRECVASKLGADYMNGSPIRQDYLHTVLSWVADVENIALEEYMAKHQHESSANAMWMYFQNVINWAKVTFPKYRKYFKGLPWGLYYNEHKSDKLDSDELEKKIYELEMDEDVTNNKGIIEYLLTSNPKHLNLRVFDEKQKMKKYQEQQGICPMCGKRFEYGEMDGDHILPWSKGGKTEYANLQMLCIACNRGGRIVV